MGSPRASLALAAALASAACGAEPMHPAVTAALGPAAGAWSARTAEARRAFDAGRWEDAARALEALIASVPAGAAREGPVPALDAAVRLAFYNLACARARLGRHDAAFDALDQALGDGAGLVGFDLLGRDPDLASLHGKGRWESLLRRLSWNEEVRIVLPSGPAAPGGAPGVVLVATEPADDLPILPSAAWTAVPTAPYSVAPGVRGWSTVLEPGERAAEKAVHALRRGEEAAGGPAARRVLAARGREAVRVAWEVLLRRPEAFTHAVLDGPAPPARALLDRGAERVRARLIVVGREGTPAREVGLAAEAVASYEEAMREALR